AGINLGKISGGISTNEENKTTTYSTANLNNLIISSSAKKYVFSNAEITGDITHYWGMTVGGIAGYNNSVIENIHITAKMLGTNSDAIYVLGGVVGVNGEDGNLVNVANNHSDIQGSGTYKTIQVNDTQARKIGYYFGKVIGRGTSSDLIMIPFNSFLNSISISNRFVNKDKFVPNEYFNVVANETNKVQTMTIEEYRAYLVNIINNQPNLSIIERINLLEPWLHSLPTEVITIPANTIQSDDVVFAEVYESNAKAEFLNWVKTNNIFEIWTDAYDGLKNNVIYDYEDYLAYRAISTELAHTAESETDFVNNIETYRDNRHQMATEFFTYKYNISSYNKISGTQNLKFKWWDYEEYLILKEYSRDYQVLSTSSEYELFEDRFGEELVKMVYPYATMVEYTDGYKVMTYSNEHLRKLLALTQEEDWQAQYQFTNKDPLQVYINYVVQLEPNESVLKIDNFEMPLVHYYYYMSELYGKNYTSTLGSYSYNYSIPTDLPIVNTNGYASYLYLNFLLDESGTNMLTIPEYIDSVKHEMPIVRENEEIWLKTGHQAGGARISDVGVVSLGWSDSDSIASVVNGITVNQDKNTFIYGDNSWNVDVEYDKAKGYGLDINKYKEIITLGGSLYEFINKYESRVVDSADKYIFGLKTQQFGWSDAQNAFIEEYFKTQNNNYDLKYAIVATTYGNILDADGVIRSVYQSSNQTLDKVNGWWYVD
ncbi:MAG: hypothetical protein IKT33_03370, partial [Clostridia bacterium]|nr:hypothetical protein [Clostridia bacterium]